MSRRGKIPPTYPPPFKGWRGRGALLKPGVLREISTEAIRGAGTWILFKPVRFRAEDAEWMGTEGDLDRIGLEFLHRHIHSWNWKGADGRVLPLPRLPDMLADIISADDLEWLANEWWPMVVRAIRKGIDVSV